MLLRSTSTPILNSWVPQSMEPSPKIISPLISLKASLNSSSPISLKMPRARSESNLRCRSRNPNDLSPISSEENDDEEEEEEEEIEEEDMLFSSSGLDECYCIFYSNDSADAYYKRRIEALRDYARYLKEVRGDFIQAEECCKQAIVENPSDAEVLSMYANLIWEIHKDASRAESYFNQAMEAAPNDCFVLGSYANFLWGAMEEVENEQESGVTAAPTFLQVATHPYPIAAPSQSIFNLWFPQSMEHSPNPDLTSTSQISSKLPQDRSENDLRGKLSTVHSPIDLSLISSEEKEDEERLFSSSGLDECCSVLDLDDKANILGGGFGGICGCGSNGGYRDGHDFSSLYNNGCGSADAYYKTMIEANPGNPLFLGNYARYLKEVRGDLTKAQEYCEPAILENPGDADVLSMYANLIWETHKDASRAESYFDQAVQAAPDNCYVLGSYARFLWDAEEEEDEEENEETAAPSFLLGATNPHLLAAPA